MIDAAARLHSNAVATPRKLDEVAAMVGVSRRTMFRLIAELGLTKYTVPGGGKAIHLDVDEVRRKRRPKPVEGSERRGD
jgi:hypothetical protein